MSRRNFSDSENADFPLDDLADSNFDHESDNLSQYSGSDEERDMQ